MCRRSTGRTPLLSTRAPSWAIRTAATVLIVVGVPVLLSVPAFLQDAPVRTGEPSPRTVIAPDTVRVSDPLATESARREAADSVTPITEGDDAARTQIVSRVRDAFTFARTVRAPDDDNVRPSRDEQIEALTDRLTVLDDAGIQQLVALSDSQLADVAQEAESIAQTFARRNLRADDLEAVIAGDLASELSVRNLPGDTAETVVAPIITAALQPTIREDPAATEEARTEAAASVQEVQTPFFTGNPIVRSGEEVTEVQFAALREFGLEGSEPWRYLVRAMGVAIAVGLVLGLYLRAYRPTVWASNRRIVLGTVLLGLYTATVAATATIVPLSQPALFFVVPAGALAMLATILFDPPIGVLSVIPVAALTAFALPNEPQIVTFAVLTAIGSVPLVSRLSARGDLRRAAWQSTLGYTLLAPLCVMTFDMSIPLWQAAGAGAVSGVLTAVVVNGSLPFLESMFGVLTATSLSDLTDRNQPLLLQLQQKALGTYNHSLMVSTMTERACRDIGADGLLGSVGALYHDIGKTQRPYFFIENQFGMANPHDELDPHDSATIIKEHVAHGIELARSHRLPPEVVDCIGCHHGTTQIAFFYRQAVAAAGGDIEAVDEAHFRYPGPRPRTREQAVLMLADCCEGTARAAALNNRDLTRDDLEGIVRGLVSDRIEDGQLDDSDLTFRDLEIVQQSLLEVLISVYHPRIAYPAKPGAAAASAAETSTDDTPEGSTPDPALVPTPERNGRPAPRASAPGSLDGSESEDDVLDAPREPAPSGGRRRRG